MPPKKKSRLSKEEIAIKKSAAEKARIEKIKSDPVLLADYKEKERQRYLKKKENGQRKCISDMTPREQRICRKKWKNYSSDYRKNQKAKKVCNNFILQNTPLESDIIKQKNMTLKKKDTIIAELKKKLNAQQKKYNRLKQRTKNITKKTLTPEIKIEWLAEDSNNSIELMKEEVVW